MDPLWVIRSLKKRKYEVKLYKSNMTFKDCIACKIIVCMKCISDYQFETIIWVFALKIFSNFLKIFAYNY